MPAGKGVGSPSRVAPSQTETMLHIRATVPSERAPAVVARLGGWPGVAHVAHLPGASTVPPGDLVLCDLAREAADDVVEWLQSQGVHRDGAIALEAVETVVSDAAAAAEAAVPGHGTDSLVWEELEATAREQAALTPSLLVLMAVATMIAGVAILLDSPILVVGAMVVGPEYGPLSALCVAAVRGRWHGVRVAATTLLVAVVVGALATFVLTVLLHATGVASADYDLTARQLTAFSSRPDALGAVIAVLAGIAGMLSLTEGRSGVLVGVLVSATTIPAIANIGVAAAYGEVPEMWGSALQLAINVVGLVLAGVGTLWVQAGLVDRRAPR
jgi:uncharacterized hydrophobic protein (TIGR00271 family)